MVLPPALARGCCVFFEPEVSRMHWSYALCWELLKAATSQAIGIIKGHKRCILKEEREGTGRTPVGGCNSVCMCCIFTDYRALY